MESTSRDDIEDNPIRVLNKVATKKSYAEDLKGHKEISNQGRRCSPIAKAIECSTHGRWKLGGQPRRR